MDNDWFYIVVVVLRVYKSYFIIHAIFFYLAWNCIIIRGLLPVVDAGGLCVPAHPHKYSDLDVSIQQ